MSRSRILLLCAAVAISGCHTGEFAQSKRASTPAAALRGMQERLASKLSRHSNDEAIVYKPLKQPATIPSTVENLDETSTNTDPVQQVSGEEFGTEFEQVIAPAPFVNEMVSVVPLAEVSLQQSINITLAQNPELITLRQTERVSSAAVGVAETYPFNPFLQVQATPYQHIDGGPDGTTAHYVLLQQTIQLAHQQQFREEGATFALNSIRWNIHQAELVTLAQAQRLYFTALYQRGLLELAEATDQNNQELQRIVENQLAAGAATAADAAIVRVDARSSRQQVQLVTANYQTALRDLARHAGVAPEQLRSVAGDLRTISWQLPGTSCELTLNDNVDNQDFTLSQLGYNARSTALSLAATRPDVMAAHSDIDVARASLSLATANKTPDLQLGPYYQRGADGRTFVGFRGQMDLQFFNDGTPLERQRAAEYCQRVTTWQQTQRRAELDAIAACERYEIALSNLTLIDTSETASLPEEFAGLERQFVAGEVDVTRVLQARTSLIANQRSRLDLLNEAAQSAANLVGATGIPIETLSITP